PGLVDGLVVCADLGRLVDCQVPARGQLHVVAATGDPCAGQAGERVGHDPYRQPVLVRVAEGTVEVGGQRGHVVIGVVQMDRAAAGQLQATGRDDARGVLGHIPGDVQG